MSPAPTQEGAHVAPEKGEMLVLCATRPMTQGARHPLPESRPRRLKFGCDESRRRGAVDRNALPELSARVVLHAPHPGTKFPFAWAAPGTWR